MKKITLLTLVLWSYSLFAFAGSENFYTGVGYSSWDWDGSSLSTFDGHLGYSYKENRSFEARFGLGVAGDEEIIAISLEDDLIYKPKINYIGLYWKPEYKVEDFSIYGLVGLVYIQDEGTIESNNEAVTALVNAGIDEEESLGTKLSFGFGADYLVYNNMSINMELRTLAINITGFAAGFSYKY